MVQTLRAEKHVPGHVLLKRKRLQLKKGRNLAPKLDRASHFDEGNRRSFAVHDQLQEVHPEN